ncbi:MAG: hypothetical protein ACREB5_04195, partial [Sphingomonadaceae bacterium]
FEARMAELDTLILECHGREPFCSGVVRDTSNRSNRDWPWWSVEVEHSQVDGATLKTAQSLITAFETQVATLTQTIANLRAEEALRQDRALDARSRHGHGKRT